MDYLSKEALQELEDIKPIFNYENRFVRLKHPVANSDTEVESTVHYIDEGKGEPIVFVHGNPTWSFYFRKVIKELKSDYRCIAMDHLGCGLSEKPTDMAYNLHSRGVFLETFLNELRIEKCHLVVHDWGGAIGMAFATRHPERIASVTVTNTAAFPSDWISWRIQLCKLPIIGRLINYNFNGFLGAAMFMTTKERIGATVKQGYHLPYKRRHERESIDQFVKDIPMSPKHPTYAELKRVGDGLTQFKDKQMLILWGKRDFCFSPYFFEKWKERFPTSKAVFYEDADHFLFEEKHIVCADQIRKHLANNQI